MSFAIAACGFTLKAFSKLAICSGVGGTPWSVRQARRTSVRGSAQAANVSFFPAAFTARKASMGLVLIAQFPVLRGRVFDWELSTEN